jgi:hypothetical protein
MATTPKRPGAKPLASRRELIELAKTMDLAEIVRKTGRTPGTILTSTKGWAYRSRIRQARTD